MTTCLPELKEKIHKEKYINAVLYFIKYCNKCLGATKLNKLMYYLDFVSFRDRKKSITGDHYLNKQFGPVPHCVDEILTHLKAENKINIEMVSINEKQKTEYTILTQPDLSVFDAYEKTLLENISKEFLLWNTEQIVNQTHLEAPWFYSKPYDIVDYNYAHDIEFFLTA